MFPWENSTQGTDTKCVTIVDSAIVLNNKLLHLSSSVLVFCQYLLSYDGVGYQIASRGHSSDLLHVGRQQNGRTFTYTPVLTMLYSPTSIQDSIK